MILVTKLLGNLLKAEFNQDPMILEFELPDHKIGELLKQEQIGE